MCVQLGPTYIKIGQILASRPDLISGDAAAQLARLQDQLPPIPVSELHDRLRAEVGEAAAAVAAIEEPAVASASIASVFKARLVDGRLVAIKVRRPGIERAVTDDLAFLRAAARFGQKLPGLRSVPLEGAIAELGTSLLGQLDLRTEAATMRHLRSALAWESAIVIPEDIPELSGPSILTMEYLESFEGRVQAPSPEAFGCVLRALYRMIFVEGLVHCDLHDGNLRLLPDGRAEVVDFGFCVELTKEDRLQFAAFFYAMSRGDGERCAGIVLETATHVPAALDRARFEQEVAELVGEAAGRSVGEFDVVRFVGGLFAIQRRHRICGTTAFTMAIVSLAVIEGAARRADASLDFQGLARQFILRGTIKRQEPTLAAN